MENDKQYEIIRKRIGIRSFKKFLYLLSMRLHLFEFEDLSWFPGVIRRGQTDYLHFVINKANIYKPAAGILKEIFDNTDKTEILDLCSGSGGGLDLVQKELEQVTGKEIRITLSDKFPNTDSYELIKKNTNGKVTYINEPVDAKKSLNSQESIRTVFSAFHHFKPDDAKAIIKDAVVNNVPIGIFEGAAKSIKYFFGILIFTPLIFIFITPFMKPFRVSRIFFTYIIPLIPITTVWDGLVSILRMYSPEEMLKMAKEINANEYTWKSGEALGKLGNTVTYLIGYRKF